MAALLRDRRFLLAALIVMLATGVVAASRRQSLLIRGTAFGYSPAPASGNLSLSLKRGLFAGVSLVRRHGRASGVSSGCLLNHGLGAITAGALVMLGAGTGRPL